MTRDTAYCTILATNYLPKALALAESLERHQPGSRLTVLLIDARDDSRLPTVRDADNVRLVGTDVLGLDERELLGLATRYDLVEFATAVKPILLGRLLEEAEEAYYLDPDTYLTAPMDELSPALQASEGGILLTPHFLEPLPEGAPTTEGHLLTVGVFNLGFCGVDRRARDFLDWWWGHLRTECLFDSLSGLFVDQKWVDIGNTLFRAASLRHPGYNVSIVNLHERPVGADDDGFVIVGSGERLRLFHFHAFDTAHPEELSTRLGTSTAHFRTESAAVDDLCREYADILVRREQELPPPPAYVYATDTAGKRISRQLRRAWRVQADAGQAPPLPFLDEDAEAWARWRRGAWRPESRELMGDALKSIRLALPEEYARIRDRFPQLTGSLRSRLVRGGGIWD